MIPPYDPNLREVYTDTGVVVEKYDMFEWPRVHSFATEDLLKEHPELKIARKAFAERNDNPQHFDPDSVLIMARHISKDLPQGSASLVFAAREILEQEARFQNAD